MIIDGSRLEEEEDSQGKSFPAFVGPQVLCLKYKVTYLGTSFFRPPTHAFINIDVFSYVMVYLPIFCY